MRRLGTICIVTLLCALLLYNHAYATHVKAAILPDTYVGIWSGTDGEQVNPSLSFTMRFGLIAGSVGHFVGTVEYPSPACGGIIALRSVAADSIELAEMVTYGACHENGIITLSITGNDSLAYEWHTTSASITATGTLTRTSVPGGAVPSNYLGVWSGQPETESYTILAALVPAGNSSVAATIIYPSLACGGTWTLQSTTPISISLFEDIDYGLAGCVDNGTVTLTPQEDGSLHYEWRLGSQVDIGRLTLISRPRVFLPLIQK